MTEPMLGDFLSLLDVARARFTAQELAFEFEVSVKTLERWEAGQVTQLRSRLRSLRSLLAESPSRVEPIRPYEFSFIDLFAGIGGTRLGFERAGGECVFTSEYDRFCQETYRTNYRPTHDIKGDIREITKTPRLIEEGIPDHDVLVAGFPCQPFSIAGVSKKNALGRAHGFECETQGTLFFEICKILKQKRPAAFLLENVRNLKSHDKGRTFAVIMSSLRDLGYYVPEPAIIDAGHWVPQHRERIFIAGFLRKTPFSFASVTIPDANPKLGSILHPQNGTEAPENPYTVGKRALVNDKYVLTAHLWNYLQRYKEKHEAAGNGFGFGLVKAKDRARTLSARYYKDGSEILVSRGERRRPRRLTPRECARLMGFPDCFRIPVSDTQAYKQFGNSVVVPVIEAVARAMKPSITTLKREKGKDKLPMAV